MKPGELVDREQRLLHRRLPRDAQEIRVRRHRPHQLRRIAPGLELADRVARMAVAEVRIALVVEVVQQPGQPPQLDVAVEPRRVGAHRGLHRQHVAPERV